MKEIRDILLAFEQASKAGQKLALATVVSVVGSAYRQPGARMLIAEDGRLTGAISGGCLEGDALRKALWVMQNQQPKLVKYDTTDEEDASLGVGLGCEGIIHILIEPIDPNKSLNPLELLRRLNQQKTGAVLVSCYSLENQHFSAQGTNLLLTPAGMQGESGLVDNEALQQAVHQCWAEKKSFTLHFDWQGTPCSALLDYIPEPLSLVIVGAGNDAIPLEKMAQLLGWDTTIVDGRPNYAKAARFSPGCTVWVKKPEQALAALTLGPATYFVLMTHNYQYDKAMLVALLPKNLPYVGMLGPKKKRDKMLLDCADQGIVFTPAQLSVLHSPVGLDLGAESPEEIALSIVAEIQTLRAKKQGSPLRLKETAIHA